MSCIQRVLTVSELAAERTRIPDIMVTCGFMVIAYTAFSTLK